MTAQRIPAAVRQLRAACDRALANPSIATSAKRAERLRKTVTTLERATADVPAEALRSLTALLHPDVIGHPDQPDTVLGRIAAGTYRTRPPYDKPLTAASQRDLMDGLADLNRAVGRAPFWWQARGMRPWSKHTREPLDFTGHVALRRALTSPTGNRRLEPFRLRLLAALEILWDTGVTREGLVSADVTDLAPECSSIRLTVNPPGRTAPSVQTFPLGRNARAAVKLWLPVRRDVVARYLERGPDAPANQALFVTLRHTVAAPRDDVPHMVPPGIRIKGNGLETDYSKWARRLNAEHEGQKGWPVPTDLYQVARGGAGQLAAGARP